MQFYKKFNECVFSSRFFSSTVITFFITILCYTLQLQNVQATSVNTSSTGNWNSVSRWSISALPQSTDNTTVNHSLTLDISLTLSGNGSLVFNASSTGTQAINISSGSTAMLIIDNNSTVTFGGGNNIKSGTIIVRSGSTLNMGNISSLNANIIVEAGAVFNIVGSVNNNGAVFTIDGLVAIVGTYSGANSAAIVEGSGDMTTTDEMKSLNDGSIFGTVNAYCKPVAPAVCHGNALGSNCAGVINVSVSPTSSTLCSGATLNITVTPTGSGTITYQWASRTGSSYSDISGATLATYTVTGTAVTTYYRVKVSSTNGNCSRYSSNMTITPTICPSKWLGSTSSDWNTPSNWSSNLVPTATDDVVIPNPTNYPPKVTGSVQAKDIIINTGSSLELLSTATLNLFGNFINSGNFLAQSGSVFVVKGSANQSISDVGSLSNLTIDKTNALADVSLFSPTIVTGTIRLLKGILVTNNNISLNFDAGANIAYNSSDAGSIVGNVTATRNLVSKTHYIGVPFSGVTSAQVQATTPLYVSPYWKMYTKDFARQNWTAVTNTVTSMPLGTGFSLSLPTTAPLKLSGTYNHAFTFTSPQYANVGTEKYFMVGNPYPSTLDWDNAAGWVKTKIGASIYYLDAATSKTVTYVHGAAINSGTQFIPAMQAFMVVCDNSGGFSSLSINNNARVSLQNPSYWRVAADDMVRVRITSGVNTALNDETVIRFNEAATNDFDFDLDAYKILNSGKNPSVYTKEGNHTYSINSYSTAESANTISLLTKLVTDDSYTFTFENNNPTIQYVLLDKKLGIEQPITQAYTFSGTTKDSTNRFELQLREAIPTIITGLQASNITRGLQINSSSKGFMIQSDRFVGEEAHIELMDMTGNTVKTMSNQPITTNTTFIPIDLAEGSYIVKVTIDSELFTGLIVLIK